MTRRSRVMPALVLLGIAAVARGGPVESEEAMSAPPVLLAADQLGPRIGSSGRINFRGERLSGVSSLHVQGTGMTTQVMSTRENSLEAAFKVDPDALPGPREIRALGPGGWSNPLTVRLDVLESHVEREPNDDQARAEPWLAESAVQGRLTLGDIDHFLLRGEPGGSIMVEVEARRLGQFFAPYLAVKSTLGRPIALGAPDPTLEGDPRLVARFPAEGRLIVEVRDQLYRGDDQVSYRLRATAAPFATGVFPLGGEMGGAIPIRLLGGNLNNPIQVVFELPREPGREKEIGALRAKGTDFYLPQRLVGSEWPESMEGTVGASKRIVPPHIINGCISSGGERDEFLVDGIAHERLHIRVEAAALGSRLDAVLSVLDDSEDVIVENDDALSLLGPSDRLGRVGPDSRLSFRPERTGPIRLAISDRHGRGGPEFAYRLAIGPPPIDYRVVLQPSSSGNGVGWNGAFNLSRGAVTRIPFRVFGEGELATVTVQAEGLPRGTRSPPAIVRIGRVQDVDAPRSFEAKGTLLIHVLEDAPITSAPEALRFNALAREPNGGTLSRLARAAVPLGTIRFPGTLPMASADRSCFPVAITPRRVDR